MYFCALDATKAFDRINHYYLLSCLIERGLPLCVINVLYSWFRNMNACIKWNDGLSTFFSVKSGVPQGSLLGPHLYNVVMDQLLSLLEEAGLGCYIAGLFAGAMAYADDLIVLSASVRHLQMILDLCVDFGKHCDILFNRDKSKCGAIGRPLMQLQAQMFLGDHLLEWADSFIYLGVEFTLGICLKVNCMKRIRKFMASVASVLRFKMEGYENVFAEILITKCLPILSYGLDCVLLDTHSTSIVSQAWNCAFRWLYGVGKFTSTRHLFEQHNSMSMRFLLDKGLLTFYSKLQTVDNAVLRKLSVCTFNDKKVQGRYESYNCSRFCSVQQVKDSVKVKFAVYCDED